MSTSIRKQLAHIGIVAGMLTACRAAEPFIHQMLWPPESLDPIAAEARGDAGIVDRLFDGLMSLDRVAKTPVPDLAAGWERVADGVYEFELAEGRRFHNGRLIRASDVVDSWQRLLDPANDSSLAWILEPIAGAAALRRGETTTLSGLEVEGPRRLRIRLQQPIETFLFHLAHPATSVVPIEEVKRLGPRFAREPVGSGPYRFASWSEDGTQLRLEAFAGHPRQRLQATPLIYQVLNPDVALRRYQTDQLDLIIQLPFGSLRATRAAFPSELRIFPSREWVGFCFRCDTPPFSDPRVRRALALAVDREDLVQELGEELRTPAVTFLPQVVPGYDPALLHGQFDPDRARRLLAAAGHPEGRGLGTLNFTHLLRSPIADFLADSFRQIGVDVEIRNRDSGFPNREQNAFFSRIGSGEFPDPDAYLRAYFHSRGGNREIAYNNPLVDERLDAARLEKDPDRRQQLYREAERLIIEDAPCVVLYHFNEAVLLRSTWSEIPIGYDPVFFEIERARRRP